MDEICCLHDRYGQQDTLFDLISMVPDAVI